jgi:hypothetical protein
MGGESRALAMAGMLILAGCAAAPPTGPSVLALPAKDKTFADFQQDDGSCRQYASALTGNASPADAAQQSAINSAAAGTVVGAAAGAAIGAAAGNPALGAAIGAGSGLLVGSAAGADAAQVSSAELQRRYDIGYLQCMSAKGESVPTTLASAPYYGYPFYPYPDYYGYYGPYWAPWGFGTSFVFIGGHHHHFRHHG